MRMQTGRHLESEGLVYNWQGTWVLFADSEVFGPASGCGVQLCFFNLKFIPDIPGAVPRL